MKSSLNQSEWPWGVCGVAVVSPSNHSLPTVASHDKVSLFHLSVPFRETPSYTNRRRVTSGPLPSPRSLLRSASDNNLNGDHDYIRSQAPREIRGRQGHSPVPSLRSLPAFAQQHSSLGEVRWCVCVCVCVWGCVCVCVCVY